MSQSEGKRVFAVMLAASFVLLLFFSRCSPLYPTNSWQDANCFFTVGRGMLKGMLPYRDFVEQKGPLLYALHALAALVSPTSFLGVYLLEAICLAFFLFFSYKSVRLFMDRGVLPVILLSAFLIVSCRAFVFGDTVEEIITPMQACSMYCLLRYIVRDERRISRRTLLLNGFLAGCVLWLKYSLLGIHFAFMAFIAPETVLRERRIGRALGMCAVFLGGMALSMLPWLAYFGANHALGDLFGVYFLNNIGGYRGGTSIIMNLARGVFGGLWRDPVLAVFYGCGVGGLIYVLARKRWSALHTAISLCVLCEIGLVYFYGKIFRYSFQSVFVFLPLCMPAAAASIRRLRASARRVGSAALACLALCLCGHTFYTNDNLPYLLYPGEELAQTRFGDYIKANGGGTLLNYGFGDGGFYLAADTLPTTPYFMMLQLNPDEIKLRQTEAIVEQQIDWLVVRNPGKSSRESCEQLGYAWVMDAQSPYDRDTKPENTIYRYALYHRVSDRVAGEEA